MRASEDAGLVGGIGDAGDIAAGVRVNIDDAGQARFAVNRHFAIHGHFAFLAVIQAFRDAFIDVKRAQVLLGDQPHSAPYLASRVRHDVGIAARIDEIAPACEPRLAKRRCAWAALRHLREDQV